MQKRLFIQYKQVFTILHFKIPSVRTLTLLQTSWESDCAFNQQEET